MRILIAHIGKEVECFIATSIIKGLIREYSDPSIDIVTLESNIPVFEYNRSINDVHLTDNIPDAPYDIFINLHPNWHSHNFVVKANEYRGFGYHPKTKIIDSNLYGTKKTNKNLFQIYYNLAGLTWRGEGYDFYYYPKNRCHKKKTGLAIANSNLKHYVHEKLKLDDSRLWTVPLKKSIYKRIDEINICPQIITDDFFTLNLAIYLRKDVYYLKTIPYNFKIEFFGKGKVFKVPANFVL